MIALLNAFLMIDAVTKMIGHLTDIISAYKILSN